MRLLNHIYKTPENLKEFILNRNVKKEKNLLIQLFTAIYDKNKLQNLIQELKKNLPNAKILGTTTSNEISSNGLHNNETIISFSIFEDTVIDTYLIKGKEDSFKTGKELINSLKNPNDKDIKVAICFSNGAVENGEELLNGIYSANKSLIIAGGMAGDYVNYGETYIFTEKGITTDGAVIATFKNPNLCITTKHSFNWDTIGKKHIVTKSVKNRVYTIDNITALEFYKHYLGDDIEKNLIENCLSLPLVIEKKNINLGRGAVKLHDDGSISYAGNINEGDTVRFGYGNTNLILEKSKNDILELAKRPIEGIYIYSCVGRKKAFTDKCIGIEIERYNEIAPMSGFLTHGEFFHGNTSTCKSRLLSLTTTLLAISENKEKKPFPDLLFRNTQKEVKRSLALNHLISRTSSELEDLSNNLKKEVINQIKKNEEKDHLLNLAQAQAEVGYMLEMIAHQWRQPLSTISAIASSLQVKNAIGQLSSNEIDKAGNDILEYSNFASQTIEDFRSLFKEKQKIEEIEIYRLIDKVKNILKSIVSKNNVDIKPIYHCDENSILKIPLGQSLQVFINIINNSIDAIKDKNIKSPIITIEIKKTDEYYLVKIEDNAGGIPEEILPKIFDKRFSTKGSKGTGLGLDICKSIIEKNLEGSIEASNGKNGAIFEIHIPIS